jgi:hypothetical protein
MRLKGKLKLFFRASVYALQILNEYQKQRLISYPRIPVTFF